MRIVASTLKKVSFTILFLAVSILIIAAIITNLDRFKSTSTIRYAKVSIDSQKNLDDILDKYSDPNTEDKFISELKRVNDLDSIDNIENAVILVPVLKRN